MPCSSSTKHPQDATAAASASKRDKQTGTAQLYVAFGSNMGNREELIWRAAKMLADKIGRIVRM